MQSSKEQQGEIRKPSSAISAKKQRKTIEWERLEISWQNSQPLPCFILYSKAKLACNFRYVLTSYFSYNAKKAKGLSEKALQIAVKRREAKSREEKERYVHLKTEFQRIARRDKKAFMYTCGRFILMFGKTNTITGWEDLGEWH